MQLKLLVINWGIIKKKGKDMKGLFVLFIVALVAAAMVENGVHKYGSLKKFVEHLKEVEE